MRFGMTLGKGRAYARRETGTTCRAPTQTAGYTRRYGIMAVAVVERPLSRPLESTAVAA